MITEQQIQDALKNSTTFKDVTKNVSCYTQCANKIQIETIIYQVIKHINKQNEIHSK